MNSTETPLPYHDVSQYLNPSEILWEDCYEQARFTDPIIYNNPTMYQSSADLNLYGVNLIRPEENLMELSSTDAFNMLLDCDELYEHEYIRRSAQNMDPLNTLESVMDEFQEDLDDVMSNRLLSDDYEDDTIMMRMVNPSEVSGLTQAQPHLYVEPYKPSQDHNYTACQPSPPIAESDPPSPVPCRRTRRTRAPRQVSINTAAKAVLKGTKRPRNSSAMTTRKQRKIGNSLETSPSGSDSEDPIMPPPTRRAPAKRAAKQAKKSAKPTKSEVQRNTHNMNEKMRRTEMTNMLDKVRNLIPQEYYSPMKTTRAKASKQKVLIAAQEYVTHLRIEGNMENAGDVTSQEYVYHILKEELSATQAKLDKVVKKFTDKYYKVKGCQYSTRRR